MRCVGQQPAFLGRACLSKSHPRPHFLWSLHLFIHFRSSNPLLCVSLGCGTMERCSFLPQAGSVPPLRKCTYHALVCLDVAWPSRGDGERELGCFPWLCCWLERRTWKHTSLICCNKIKWVQDVGLL